MSTPKSTPMIKQYLSIKEKYPDAILMYRMGDFYEMFFEDAKTASRVLEITLTARNKKDPEPVPMCGVPYRAVQSYIARLIENGHKVAICDQVEDPAQAKGLVKREVVRVVTPGMVIESELLDAKTNNYLLAIARNHTAVGLSYLDLSTGTFRLTESHSVQLIVDEILRVSPREILLPEVIRSEPAFSRLRQELSEKAVTYLPDTQFRYDTGRERLMEQFQTLNLEGFGCEDHKAGVGAAGALMHYVQETQLQKVEHFEGVETYQLDHYLWVDELSCRNLELIRNIRTGSRNGTLIGVLDNTRTAMGGRMLHQWVRYPLLDPEVITARQDAVEAAKNRIQLTQEIRELLKGVYDLQRLRSKITMGRANARDLVALKQSLQALPEIRDALSQFDSALLQWNADTAPLDTLADLIHRAIREDAPPTLNEGGLINPGYDKELDELIQISRDGKGWLVNLEQKEKEKTGINSLKVRFNKVFGYYIEIPKTHSDTVPGHYIRKQTLVNAERYITDELKGFESKVLGAEEQRAAMEYELFNQVRHEVVKAGQLVHAAALYLATVDCILNLAEIAEQNDYARPEINTEGRIEIEDGRHPVVEKVITGERFVPNTIHMNNNDRQVLIITGPNMAGKSTVLRQTALMVVMAQMGAFVPAKSASISMTDRIFTRVGALDNLASGQSTFMVEMQETANILNNAGPNSLVVMDEIGRGTSTFDGMSIAWAVAEYLHDLKNHGVKTLFATHYHELTELASSKERVQNYNIAVKEWNDEIIFLRKLVEGGTNRSYGIQVARLAGIPKAVIKRSKKILARIESERNGPPLNDISAAEDDDQKNRHIQMELFQKPDTALIEKLQKLDIARMTPMDAMNLLYDLTEKAKHISN